MYNINNMQYKKVPFLEKVVYKAVNKVDDKRSQDKRNGMQKAFCPSGGKGNKIIHNCRCYVDNR